MPRLTLCLLILAATVLMPAATALAQAERCSDIDAPDTSPSPSRQAAPASCQMVRTPASVFLPMNLVRHTGCSPAEAQPEVCRLCRRSRCQLMQACQLGAQAGRLPHAETVFGRGRLTLGLAAADQTALVASMLSQSPAMALEITARGRSDGNAETRYALALAAAYVIAKTDLGAHRSDYNALLRALRQDARAVSFATSDVDFLEAVASIADGTPRRALQSLDTALAKERDFFAAAALAARTQADVLRTTPLRSTEDCLDGYRKLLWYLSLMMDVQTCPRQAIHIDVYLQRSMGDPTNDDAILASQVYLAIMARRPENARRALTRFSERSPRLVCRAEIAADLAALVSGTADLVAPR